VLLDNIYRRTKDETKKGLFSIILEQRYGDSAVFEIMGDLGKCEFRDKSLTRDAFLDNDQIYKSWYNEN